MSEDQRNGSKALTAGDLSAAIARLKEQTMSKEGERIKVHPHPPFLVSINEKKLLVEAGAVDRGGAILSVRKLLRILHRERRGVDPGDAYDFLGD